MSNHPFFFLLGHYLRNQINQVPEENCVDECVLMDNNFRDLVTKIQLSLFSNTIIMRSVFQINKLREMRARQKDKKAVLLGTISDI